MQAGRAAVYEVDFAEQLERKRALLAAGGVELPAWIAHVACDFAAPDVEDALLAALGERGFRPHPNAWACWVGTAVV
ncbi:MAG: class I SAM-dependent methyltransferase [Polyangiaceae bacterium]|nr:class I SAM-dependent methyltransferase [Polyangiaceae bacterium]